MYSVLDRHGSDSFVEKVNLLKKIKALEIENAKLKIENENLKEKLK